MPMRACLQGRPQSLVLGGGFAPIARAKGVNTTAFEGRGAAVQTPGGPLQVVTL